MAPSGSSGNHYQKLQEWLQLVLRLQLQQVLQLQLVLRLQLQLQLRVLWGNPNFSNFKFWKSDPGDRCAELRRVCWCTQNFENPNFTPSNLLCGFYGLVLLVFWYFWYSGTSGTSGTLVFWYFVKLGFHFPGVLATEKVRSKCQNDPWGRAQLSMVVDCWKLSLFQNPNFGPR